MQLPVKWMMINLNFLVVLVLRRKGETHQLSPGLQSKLVLQDVEMLLLPPYLIKKLKSQRLFYLFHRL